MDGYGDKIAELKITKFVLGMDNNPLRVNCIHCFLEKKKEREGERERTSELER